MKYSEFKRFIPVLPFVAYFAFLLLFVSPAGNFPLNDDWSYGEGVRKFLSTGKLLMPTVCAPGFPSVFLGILLCKAFGFSYVCLRALTLSFGFIGCIALYAALREAGVQRKVSAMLLLIYASNPLYVNVWFTFMSDVPALSLINIYLYLLIRAVRRKSQSFALLSILALSLAVATRQSAIVLLPCSLALLTFKDRKWFYPLTLAAFVIPTVIYVGDDYWLKHRIAAAHDYVEVKEVHWHFIKDWLTQPLVQAQTFITQLGQTTCYLGLFCLPAIIAFLLQINKLFALSSLFCLIPSLMTVGISAARLVFIEQKFMPFNRNLLRIPSVGAQDIIGACLPDISLKACRWLTLVSYICAFSLIWVVVTGIQFVTTSPRLFNITRVITGLCVIGAVSTTLFCTVETVVRSVDRYYLLALAPVLLSLGLIARYCRIRLAGPVPLLCVALIAGYSACAAQDYLNRSRAQWDAISYLEQRDVPFTQIDGGASYNIMHGIDIYNNPYRGQAPRNSWRWWPIRSEKYIISYTPIPDYDVIDRVPFWSVLAGHKEVVVLKAKVSN